MTNILDEIRRTAQVLEQCEIRPEDVKRWRRAAAEIERLRTGIRSIIRQVRQSAVLSEDAQAVADQLEALVEGRDDG